MASKSHLWDEVLNPEPVNRTNRPTVPALEALLGKEIPVLDHGFIRLIDYLGNDSSIVQAARVSYGAGTKTKRDDRNLIRYLMRNGHWSPFEMCVLKYHVKLPIFVARHWIRHKGSVNECSGRYSVLTDDNYIPNLTRIAKQSTDSKQGSGESFTESEAKEIQNSIVSVFQYAEEIYKQFIDKNMAKELARIIKTTGGYTEWYWQTNLRDLLHFCRLRSDSHAQYETRAFSDALRDNFLKVWVPDTYQAYVDYIQNAVTLSGPAIKHLFNKITGYADDNKVPKGMGKTELKEFNEWYYKNLNNLPK